MQKRAVIVSILVIILLSSFVVAKQGLYSPTVVRPAEVFRTSEKPVSTTQSGFEMRKALFDSFPDTTDKRVRKSDLSRIIMIRSLLSQTLEKKLYRPNFKTLNCAGKILFDKDRSMVEPFVELACLRGVQIPLLRGSSFGRPFITSGVVSKITGRAAAGIYSVQKSDCNEALKDIAFNALQVLMESEHALVTAELAVSSCGDLTNARTVFARGETHVSGLRFASAINSHEDAWRKAVSCICRSIG